MRTLVSGRKVESGKPSFPMTIDSECPDKWLFVDLETGDVWHVIDRDTVGDYPRWRGASRQEMRELKKVANMRRNFPKTLDNPEG